MRLILIFSLFLFSCSSTFHLKKAIKKNPGLSLTDTIVDVQIRPIEPFNLDFNIITLNKGKIVLEGVRARDTVKIYLERDGDLVRVEADCPDCIDSVVYIPKVQVVKEELNQRELYKEAKERMSDWNKIRLMAGELVSVFILGILSFFIVNILIKRFL